MIQSSLDKLENDPEEGEMKKVFMVSMLLGICCVAPIATTASAEEMKYKLNENSVMREVLENYTGKGVYLSLASGQEIAGTVTMVGSSLVHVSRLAGMEYYDAVVRVDNIVAVKMRMRGQ